MLYILFMLLLLIPTLIGYGKLMQINFKIKDQSLTVLILSGIFFCTILFTLLAFFFPLHGFLEYLIIVIGIVLFIYYKSYKNVCVFIKQDFILLIPISLLIIFTGSYFPFILDHFGYYVPTVKWISEVGLVRGISNLDLILGQMSLWHILQAGFSHFSDFYLRINVLVLVVYLIYILEKKHWIHLFFLPFLTLFSQSPATDLPVIVFSLIILNEILKGNKEITLLLTASVFVFSIKPTMIWLPIFTSLYAFAYLRAGSIKITLPALAVLFLFFTKNLWTFGFPVFPVHFMDFDFSWKPSAELLQNSSQLALQKTFDMQYSFSEIEQFSTAEFIKNWLFLPGIKGFIHLSFIFTLFVFLFLAVLKKSKIIWLLFISVFAKIIFVLSFSAQYRFFFEIFFIVIFLLFFQIITRKYALIFFSFTSVLVVVFLSFPAIVQSLLPSFKLGNFMTGFTTDQFIKPAHFEWKKYKTHKIGNLKFNVVDDYFFTFQTPLPAISPQFLREDLEAGVFPQLKGKSLREGFIWRKISPEEQQKLREILKDFQ